MKQLIVLGVLVALIFVTPARGGQFYGGPGLIHTSAALTMPPGALDLSFFARGFITPVSDVGYTISNGTSAFAASFGFTRHAELGFTQVLYQDLNSTFQGKSLPLSEIASSIIPGDTYIRFKIAGYQAGNIYWGIAPALRYRVARFHDVHLEPYESNGVEAELAFLASYYQKPLYPDEGYSVHLNAGLLNHNDADVPTDASMDMQFLVSFLKPTPRFDYGMELYGAFFVTQPPLDVLGRENWMYITPLLRYKLYKGLHFTVGVDVLLLGHDNTTVNAFIPDLDLFPNYSTWRISGRVHFTPSTAFYVAPTFTKVDERRTGRERSRVMQAPTGAVAAETPAAATAVSGGGELYDRQELFRWAIEERFGGREAVDVDLEKIKQERKRAEEELKRLQRELQEKKK